MIKSIKLHFVTPSNYHYVLEILYIISKRILKRTFPQQAHLLPNLQPPSSHPKTSARGTDPRDAQLGRGGHGRASGRGRHNTASTSKPKTSTITPGDDLPPLPEHDDEVDSLLSLKAKINKNTLELTQPEANAGNLGPDFEEEKRAMQNQHLSQMLQNGTPTTDDDKSVISVSSSTLHDPNDSTEADTHDDTSSSQQTE